MTYEEFLEKVNEYNNNPEIQHAAIYWIDLYFAGVELFKEAVENNDMRQAKEIDDYLRQFAGEGWDGE